MSSSNAKFQKCVIFELFVINKAGGLILHQVRLALLPCVMLIAFML